MFTTRPEIVGTFGVASSTHWLATQTALGVLERGGNAFDAAVAAGFVLQVVEPHLNGPGGDVTIILWGERDQAIRTVCGQGPAPALADAASMRVMGLELVPGIGLLPATVPGAFGAWLTMLRDYGTWSLADVRAPAIGYARDGFPVVPRISRAILAVRELFLAEWQSAAATWLVDGRVPRPGHLHSLPVLAQTYTRIFEEAQQRGGSRVGQIDAALDYWYRGIVARKIDGFCANTAVHDTTGERHTGLLRYEDMAGWTAEVEPPVTLEFGRYAVAKCGIWSQGPNAVQLRAERHFCI